MNVTSIAHHQKRGVMATAITCALKEYDEFMKDDRYDFSTILHTIIDHLETARSVAFDEAAQ